MAAGALHATFTLELPVVYLAGELIGTVSPPAVAGAVEPAYLRGPVTAPQLIGSVNDRTEHDVSDGGTATLIPEYISDGGDAATFIEHISDGRNAGAWDVAQHRIDGGITGNDIQGDT